MFRFSTICHVRFVFILLNFDKFGHPERWNVGGVLFTFSEISWRNNQKDLFEKTDLGKALIYSGCSTEWTEFDTPLFCIKQVVLDSPFIAPFAVLHHRWLAMSPKKQSGAGSSDGQNTGGYGQADINIDEMPRSRTKRRQRLVPPKRQKPRKLRRRPSAKPRRPLRFCSMGSPSLCHCRALLRVEDQKIFFPDQKKLKH